MINELIEYVHAQADRGECHCGKCIDAVENPGQVQSHGHTVNMIFFKVSAKPTANAETLRKLIEGNQNGEFCRIDMFDGQEHGYMDVGGWIGDQGTALMLMGLGTILGLWKLMSPITMLHLDEDEDAPMVMKMVGTGFLFVKSEKTAEKEIV